MPPKRTKQSEETKRKISLANKGKSKPKLMGNTNGFKKGQESIMKGKHHTEETKKKISDSKKGSIAWNKGKKMPSGVLVKLRKSHLGQKAWNKGIPMKKSSKEKLRKALIGKKQSLESKIKRSNSMKERYKKDPSLIKRCLKKNPKSSLEIKFENIIKKHNLPYKFVGNGEVLVGRKCPDFVNVNGKKIAIEVFYSRHKDKFANGLVFWMTEREKLFKEYGWQLEFFNEIQVNEDEIKRRLG